MREKLEKLIISIVGTQKQYNTLKLTEKFPRIIFDMLGLGGSAYFVRQGYEWNNYLLIAGVLGLTYFLADLYTFRMSKAKKQH